MGSITVDDIWQANELAPTSAASWSDFLLGLEKNITYLDSSVSQPTNKYWTGTAAQLAAGNISASKNGLIKTASQLNKIQGIIEDFNRQLNGWATQLSPLMTEAASSGFTVHPDGSVTLPDTVNVGGLQLPGNMSPQEVAGLSGEIAANDPSDYATFQSALTQYQTLETKRQGLQTQIQAILAAAEKADEQTATQLRQQLPELGGTDIKTTPWKSAHSSLWQIAQEVYGDGNQYMRIWNANKAKLIRAGSTGPGDIPVGFDLTIPPLPGTGLVAPAAATPQQIYALRESLGGSGSGTPLTQAQVNALLNPTSSAPPAVTPADISNLAIANGVAPPAGTAAPQTSSAPVTQADINNLAIANGVNPSSATASPSATSAQPDPDGSPPPGVSPAEWNAS